MKAVLLVGILLFQEAAVRPPAPAASPVIAGQLSFADASPVAMVLVSALPVPAPGQPAGRPIGMRSTESGGYRFFAPPGRYLIRVNLSPDAVFYYPGVATEAAATIVTVAAGSNADNLNFALPSSASGVKVHGHVKFQSNQPRLQTVELRAGPNPQAATAAVGVDGAFEYPHVQPGLYSINLPVPGFQPVNIAVRTSDIDGIELTVPKLTSVTGSVALDGATTKPQFSVAFEGTGYRPPLTSVADGTFTAQLPAGVYRVMLSGLQSGFYLKSLNAGTSDLLKNPLKVSDSDSPIRLAMTFGASAGVKVAGHVSASDSEPGFTRKLVLDGIAVSESVDTIVNSDGSFELPKVNPGTYAARVTLTRSVFSPSVSVVIPAKNVDNLQVAVPPAKEISGSVAVVGNGPPPKFTVLLVRGADANLNDAKPVELAAFARNGNPGNQVLQVSVGALPDGTFKMKVPQGDYRVTIPSANGIPPGYVLTSASYGSADLLKDSLHVSDNESPEMQFGFGTSAPNPWIRLKGRVKGFDPTNGPFRVALEGSVTSTIETPVNPDGSFEFLSVLPRSNYTARLMPIDEAATSPRINVADKDVDDVEIVVPPEREIAGIASMERNGSLPGFMLTLAAGTSSTISLIVKPENNGTFRIKLPGDERRVRVDGLPLGYTVKSMTFGSTDVLKQPLKITEAGELHLTFALDSAVRSGTIQGRVSGLDPNQPAVRIALNGVASFAVFETPVSPTGAFSFSEIPQGAYQLSLRGGSVSAALSPASLIVTGSDMTDVEIAASAQKPGSERVPFDAPQTGASILDMGVGGRDAANESAAVGRLRTVETAEVVFLSTSGGKYGSLSELISAGLLDTSFKGPVSGFTYSVISLGNTFAVAGIPVSVEAGRFGFFGMPDGVIRYSTFDLLAPLGKNGKPVQ